MERALYLISIIIIIIIINIIIIIIIIIIFIIINPTNAKATLVQCTTMQRFLKSI